MFAVAKPCSKAAVRKRGREPWREFRRQNRHCRTCKSGDSTPRQIDLEADLWSNQPADAAMLPHAVGAGYGLGSNNCAASRRQRRKVNIGSLRPGWGQFTQTGTPAGCVRAYRVAEFCVDKAVALLSEGRCTSVRQRQGAQEPQRPQDIKPISNRARGCKGSVPNGARPWSGLAKPWWAWPNNPVK